MQPPTPYDNPGLELLLFRINQQADEISALKQDVQDLEDHINTQDSSRAKQEKRQLVAGISFLGSMVCLLFGVIWSYRSVIFRG